MNWQNVTVKLSDLQPWEHNPRTMTKKQAQRLLKSWQDLGQFQTIAIGPANNGSGCPVYDGHQRLSALLAAYGAQYAIDARQSDRALTEDERRYLITQANLPVGAWNFETIAGWPEAQEWGFDTEMLKTWNSDAAALATMLAAEQQGDADAEPQIDRAAELNEKWQVKTGDLWRIGAHRLLCGDSTKREDVERVSDIPLFIMATDPPYGVEYDPSWRLEHQADSDAGSRWNKTNTRINTGDVENDDRADWREAWALFTGDVVYVWHGGKHANRVQESLEFCGFEIRSQIIWVKQAFVFSRGDYHWQHEPCWYAVRKGKSSAWIGDRKQATVWEFRNNAAIGDVTQNEESTGHGTQKPLQAMTRPIQNHSGDVYDPFVGSGTTLVACQNLQRKCRAIEISPNYCAVILERMATAFPGIEIERISEAVLTHGT